jgi:hypothetical protein
MASGFIASLADTFILAHYAAELLPFLDSITPNPENDIDRFWGRTDDNPDQARDEEDFELKSGGQSIPHSPLRETSRKRSLAKWDSDLKNSIVEEHVDLQEAPGRLQHTRDGSPTFQRGYSVSTQPSDPPSPDFSRTPSQSTVATVDGITPHRTELVRSHSDVPHSWIDSDGSRRYEPFVRERKESSASSISSRSAGREEVKRQIVFWEGTPEDIAVSLTKLEWEFFIALTVWLLWDGLMIATRYTATYVVSGG